MLVAMNAAALKTQLKYSKPQATIIIDTDSFGPNDLKKAEFKSEDFWVSWVSTPTVSSSAP